MNDTTGLAWCSLQFRGFLCCANAVIKRERAPNLLKLNVTTSDHIVFASSATVECEWTRYAAHDSDIAPHLCAVFAASGESCYKNGGTQNGCTASINSAGGSNRLKVTAKLQLVPYHRQLIACCPLPGSYVSFLLEYRPG
jgi:hypothetical protein